jgi:hypothetical protein
MQPSPHAHAFAEFANLRDVYSAVHFDACSIREFDGAFSLAFWNWLAGREA